MGRKADYDAYSSRGEDKKAWIKHWETAPKEKALYFVLKQSKCSNLEDSNREEIISTLNLWGRRSEILSKGEKRRIESTIIFDTTPLLENGCSTKV